ncbi:hypothetical protein [Sphingobacterium multivorum]|uniref:hypothetical protein n=1 Tax=Sphingobacterium multivorum TaxID=28454 RepID=UPI00345E238F
MEPFLLVCTILGAIASAVAILAFRNDHAKKRKEEKEFLILQFSSTRRLSLSVTEKLENYCKKYNAFNDPMFEGTTFGEYILMLKNSQKKNLSKQILDTMFSLSPTKPMIDSMVKSLENQFNELLKIDTWLDSKLIIE